MLLIRGLPGSFFLCIFGNKYKLDVLGCVLSKILFRSSSIKSLSKAVSRDCFTYLINT